MHEPPFLWTRLMNVYENGMGAILIVSHKSFCCSIDFLEWSICHRCLYEPVAWYWLGWRESPLAHSVEHWSRKQRTRVRIPAGAIQFFSIVFASVTMALQRGFGVSLCGKIFLVKLAKVRLYLQSRGRDSSWRGNMSQVFVRTSRLILTRLEGIPFSSIGRALVS